MIGDIWIKSYLDNDKHVMSHYCFYESLALNYPNMDEVRLKMLPDGFEERRITTMLEF